VTGRHRRAPPPVWQHHDVADLLIGIDGLLRCWWCGEDETYVAYHDQEWGVPLRDERALYEKICLEGFQSGLSWITILRKRPAFREAFHGFDVDAVAAMDEDDVERLAADARIVRHRGKIRAAIANARAVQAMREAGTSLVEVVWAHQPPSRPAPLVRRSQIPVRTTQSAALAADLRRWGMRFVGPTTAYSLMQSAGLVDDHLEGCHRAGG